jgi:hypothetical protein
MLRSILAALSSATRYIFALPFVVGNIALAPFRWMAMAALPPPALDAIGAAAGMALNNDMVVEASASDRRAAREARRALSAEITQAVDAPVLKSVPLIDADKPTKFKFTKPKELRGLPHPSPAKPDEPNPEARQVQRFLFNSLAGGVAYAVPPSLHGLPPRVKEWVKGLDRNQRKLVIHSGSESLQRHMLSDDVADWSGRLPPINPERARLHREYVECHGGLYYNPARQGAVSIRVMPPKDLPADLEDAEAAFGPYVGRR